MTSCGEPLQTTGPDQSTPQTFSCTSRAKPISTPNGFVGGKGLPKAGGEPNLRGEGSEDLEVCI